VPPVNAFRPSETHRAGGPASIRLMLLGAFLLACAWGVQYLPGNSPVAGFAMAVLIALGFAMACPWLTGKASQAVDVVARRMQWIAVQMSGAAVGRSLGITGVAVAATMLAMAMNISVRTMVFSFRSSLAGWMQQRFAADIFIAPQLLIKHHIDSTIDPKVAQWVRAQPETEKVVTYRMRGVQIGAVETTLMATDVREEIRTMPMKKVLGGPGAFDPAADAIISEPLAGRLHLSTGGTFALSSPAGPQHFRVYGVFYDFGNEHGVAAIDGSTYADRWRDRRVNSLHVTLRPGVDRGEIAARWSAVLRATFPVEVNSSRAIKTEVLEVFDRTFAVTNVLTWLAGGVAFCGLAGSLLALALARQRDYSVLAAIGMTGRQTLVCLLCQGMIIAWSAAALASAAGTILAFVLAYVIQYRSFGWSIPTSAQPRFWLQNLALATAAAVVASIYPAWKLRRSPPALGLRQE